VKGNIKPYCCLSCGLVLRSVMFFCSNLGVQKSWPKKEQDQISRQDETEKKAKLSEIMNTVKSHTEPSEAITQKSRNEPRKEGEGRNGREGSRTHLFWDKTPEFSAPPPLPEPRETPRLETGRSPARME